MLRGLVWWKEGGGGGSLSLSISRNSGNRRERNDVFPDSRKRFLPIARRSTSVYLARRGMKGRVVVVANSINTGGVTLGLEGAGAPRLTTTLLTRTGWRQDSDLFPNWMGQRNKQGQRGQASFLWITKPDGSVGQGGWLQGLLIGNFLSNITNLKRKSGHEQKDV